MWKCWAVSAGTESQKMIQELFGSPGKKSGLILRIGQCVFAAASIGVMASASGFSATTAFCYLIASMGLQVLWSFGLVCLDIHALRFNKDLHNHIIVSLFVVGDWLSPTGIKPRNAGGIMVQSIMYFVLEFDMVCHALCSF
ncbi:hypothetical protein BUALT_Bualt06G0048500 [Buddleja alternifolia]|uniref:CASP-like protein n=1 Tax=Buddleja alternifolia TaxID=168488 RepID=A0AAV6XHB5_9LAMI|nr:hypothetical protein BUALT_Bualt06G0048500 [Buddleja alternifolia]